MAVMAEQKVMDIEDSLKALKATYSISGGLMKLYESVSDVYSSSSDELRIQFTPTYTNPEGVIVASFYYEFRDENNVAYNFSQYVYIEPETGNGNIVFRMPMLGGTAQLKVISTSPGTFTRLV